MMVDGTIKVTYFLVLHLNNGFVNVIKSKVTGLPWCNHSIIWSSNQHQLVDSQEILPPLGHFPVWSLSIQQGQIIAALQEAFSLVWVIPEVADGQFLSY